MKSFIPVLLVTAMVVVIPFAQARTVTNLINQFKPIFQWYLKYRMTESTSPADKDDAMKQVVILVEAFHLHTDQEANFVFGLIDMEAFVDRGTLDSQLHTIFKAGDTDNKKFEYPRPSRSFKHITGVNLTPENFRKFSSAEQFVRKNYAKRTGISEKNVALEYELVETADLNQENDRSNVKQYMLFMLGNGTKN